MNTNFYFINFLDFGLMTIRSVDLDPASKNASFIPPEILLHQQVKKQKKNANKNIKRWKLEKHLDTI